MISFTRFAGFIGLCLMAVIFLVTGSFHLDWSHKGEPPGIQASLRFQLPSATTATPQEKRSFGGWLKQVMVVSFGERSEKSLFEQLAHPEPNVDYDTPRYRVTPATIGRRLMALIRIGPYLDSPSPTVAVTSTTGSGVTPPAGHSSGDSVQSGNPILTAPVSASRQPAISQTQPIPAARPAVVVAPVPVSAPQPATQPPKPEKGAPLPSRAPANSVTHGTL